MHICRIVNCETQTTAPFFAAGPLIWHAFLPAQSTQSSSAYNTRILQLSETVPGSDYDRARHPMSAQDSNPSSLIWATPCPCPLKCTCQASCYSSFFVALSCTHTLYPTLASPAQSNPSLTHASPSLSMPDPCQSHLASITSGTADGRIRTGLGSRSQPPHAVASARSPHCNFCSKQTALATRKHCYQSQQSFVPLRH